MEVVSIEKGHILLAEPFMIDPNFQRSAVLLCDHGLEDGTVGFIMNKPMEVKVDEVIEDFPEFDAAVYYGGPVAPDTIHYIHNKGDILDDSLEISKGVFWGGDFNKLKFLIDTKLITQDHIRFFIGYSGWSAGQLLDELSYGSWLLADLDVNYVFNMKHNSMWRQIMENKGRNYSVIAQMPDTASWN